MNLNIPLFISTYSIIALKLKDLILLLDKTTYKILNIDQFSKSCEQINKISNTLEIECINSENCMESLEILIDTSVNAILIHTASNLKQGDILRFLDMLSSDIENQDTPIIIISNEHENELLAETLADYNIISIITYSNWYYQVKPLLSNLVKLEKTSTNLQIALSHSEVRNIADPLTKLYNRFGAEDTFINYSSRYLAYKESFSLIIMDIDHFKKVNDTYGHDIGDEVIISFSEIIQRTIRPTDKAVRFGGEEFLIFLPNSDLSNSVKIAEKIRLAMQNNLHSTKKLEVTASFGVVEFKGERSLVELVKRADLLLYKAKDSGRNIVIHDSNELINSDKETTLENEQPKNEQLIYSNLILNQYYHAVNVSSIVSKADIRGRISFVNDKFIQLSGYSEAELLGQPHNIVRDPSMSSETFQELWETISSKKVWSGVVTNKRKNGTTYTVQAYIFPILDNDNNIIEYFSLRHILEE